MFCKWVGGWNDLEMGEEMSLKMCSVWERERERDDVDKPTQLQLASCVKSTIACKTQALRNGRRTIVWWLVWF